MKTHIIPFHDDVSLSGLSKLAKKESKEQGKKLAYVLDSYANHHGYRNWQLLKRASLDLSVDRKQANAMMLEYIESMSTVDRVCIAQHKQNLIVSNPHFGRIVDESSEDDGYAMAHLSVVQIIGPKNIATPRGEIVFSTNAEVRYIRDVYSLSRLAKSLSKISESSVALGDINSYRSANPLLLSESPYERHLVRFLDMPISEIANKYLLSPRSVIRDSSLISWVKE